MAFELSVKCGLTHGANLIADSDDPWLSCDII